MSFLQKIKESIYSPQFYKTLPNLSFGSSLGYYLLLTFFLTIIQVAFLAVPLLTIVNKQIQSVPTTIISAFPADLSVTVKNGQVTTNVEEPYAIPFPNNNANNVNSPKNFIIIDTQTPFSISKFDEYDTMAWVGKNNIYYRNNTVQVINIPPATNLVLDKQTLGQLSQKITPMLKFVAPSLVAVIAIALFFLYLFRLIPLLLLAVLILILMKFVKPALSFGQSYIVCLHAVTLGLIVETLLRITNPFFHVSGFPFMTTVFTILIVALNFTQAKQMTVEEKVVPNKRIAKKK